MPAVAHAPTTKPRPTPKLQSTPEPTYCPITLEQFLAFGAATYGPSWKQHLGDRLGWHKTHMHRICSGKRRLPYRVHAAPTAPTYMQVFDEIARERIAEIMTVMERMARA